MAVTIRDVAALAGVSFKTVSNVINNHPHVSAATRSKVEAAIAELGYQPNLAARSLRSGLAGSITLAVPDLKLPYFAELADSVIREARERGLALVIEHTDGDRDLELDLLRSPRLNATDGLLLSPLGLGQSDADLLRCGVPMVLLGERVFHPGFDHVTMQNVDAARAATEYLIDLGFRRIAVIGGHRGEVIGSAGLRLRGYREALDSRGIAFDEGLIAYAGQWHRANGAAGMTELLDRGVDFDAVFGFNDTLALGALRVLQESGRRVPGDVAVIGFDDLDETRYSQPALTTVDPGREEISRTAVQLLVERIGGLDGPGRRVEVGFRLITRESTPPREVSPPAGLTRMA